MCGHSCRSMRPSPTSSGIVERYAYGDFGRELAGSTPAVSSVNTVRFSTKQADIEIALNYYGYRFYATNTGRWINRDPIKEKGGMNIYAFCNNDATLLWDKLGNDIWV